MGAGSLCISLWIHQYKPGILIPKGHARHVLVLNMKRATKELLGTIIIGNTLSDFHHEVVLVTDYTPFQYELMEC